MAEWHYIGNYGELGPLKEDQMQELIEVGVIESKTYVWREGLADWSFAKDIPELSSYFESAPYRSAVPPPPPPVKFDVQGPGPFDGPKPDSMNVAPISGKAPPRLPAAYQQNFPTDPHTIISDKKRALAGFLNFLPGFGRFYLGYSSIGLLQFILTPCFFIGWIWSIVDGFLILAGACPEDGYGRRIVS